MVCCNALWAAHESLLRFVRWESWLWSLEPVDFCVWFLKQDLLWWMGYREGISPVESQRNLLLVTFWMQKPSVCLDGMKVIYTGNLKWGGEAFNGHNFQSSVMTSGGFDLLTREIKQFCFRSWFVGANVGDGVIIEGWLTKHIALRHRCRIEGRWIDGEKNTEKPSPAGWREGNLKASVYMILCMVAFHSKLADFLFLLWIMNFIKTAFCQKSR